MKIDFRNIKTVLATLLCGGLMVSCADVFETDSSSVAFEEGNRLDSPNDSLYSVMGILSQFQKLGERYVLMGDLRGDLMTATTDAVTDIQEVSNFNVSPANSYCEKSDYYNVINNCNYAITRMDTTIQIDQEKVMLPEFVAIKAIRAWTYWQLALTYGKAKWIEEPILNLEASLEKYPERNQEELATLLIEDLQPYLGVRALNYGSVDGYDTRTLFVPLPMLLGDLYLFMNDYERAASMYYKVINDRTLRLSSSYASNWSRNTRESASMYHAYSYSGEFFSGMMYSSDPRDYHPKLIRLSYNSKPSVVPSAWFMSQMSQAMHFYADPTTSIEISAYLEGDLRGEAVTAWGEVEDGSYGVGSVNKERERLIMKYRDLSIVVSGGFDPMNPELGSLEYTRFIPIYRIPHAYLRYAEALNRAGKPSIAFAVLKYGLNKKTMTDPTKINLGELKGETYTDFSSVIFDDNVGTASRGRGRGIVVDNQFYVIPDYTRYVTVTDEETGEETQVPTTDPVAQAEALADSILFVEDCIVDEMAAETSFEGNRFFDLLRVARHRQQYPAYMADKVSRRFVNADAMKARLMNEEAWYLK